MSLLKAFLYLLVIVRVQASSRMGVASHNYVADQ